MILGTVGHGAGVLVPALDGAGVAVALADAGHVYSVALCEDVARNGLTDRVGGNVLEAELAQIAGGVHARLREVA